MASYTVYVVFTGAKGASVMFRYPGLTSNSTNNYGTGSSSSNPLELQIGDTVTFATSQTSGPGYVTVSDLAIFTNNSDFILSWSGNTSGYPTSVTRTVSTGGTALDQIIATQSAVAAPTDDFYVRRNIDDTPDGFVSGGWVGAGSTNTTYYASFNSSVTASSSTAGTYQVTGLTSGVAVPISLAYDSVNSDVSTESFFSVNGATWYSPSSTGITTDNNDIIRWRIKSASAGSQTVRYKLTIGDTTKTLSIATAAAYGISVSPSSVAGNSNVTVSWSATSYGTYYYNSTYFGSGTLGTGTSGTKILTASNSFSGSSVTDTITLKTGSSSGTTQATSNTVTIDRQPGTPSVSTSSVTSSSFIATASAGSPNVGTLQVSINNSTWFTSPKSFTGLSANQNYTVLARQVNGVAVSGTGTTSVITQSGVSYSLSSPSTVNEGQNLSFSITTTGVTNGTTVGWSLAGLQSGDYTTSSSDPIAIYNNSATVTLAIINDNITDGNKTAVLTLDPQDSVGNSTGGISSSTTVVDTSNPGGGGGTGSGTSQSGGTGSFGLLIRNSLDTATIIDGSSRITNFLDVDSINTLSQSSKNMFTTFDCSDKTETGVIVTWTGNSWTAPTFTRRSASLGGVTVTKNTNDTSSSTSGTATVYLIRY